MKKLMLMLIVAGFMPIALFAEDFTQLGENLEKQIWENMKQGNWAAVSQQIAPYFQSIHDDGARDKVQEMKLIKDLDLGKYTLSKFQVTEGDGNTIIVSYWVAVQEDIDNEKLPTAPAARLSVWQKNANDEWQWIVHANLNPIEK